MADGRELAAFQCDRRCPPSSQLISDEQTLASEFNSLAEKSGLTVDDMSNLSSADEYITRFRFLLPERGRCWDQLGRPPECDQRTGKRRGRRDVNDPGANRLRCLVHKQPAERRVDGSKV